MIARRHDNLLSAQESLLLICDLQEVFRGVIDQFDAVVRRTAIVAQAAALLGIPILVTEQSPQKLGATVAEVKAALPSSVQPLAKTSFSCCGAAGFDTALKSAGRHQIMLAGIEAHVCMNQTAHDLLAGDLRVHLLCDCTSSRTAANRELGISKMLRDGCVPSGCEMALFELLRDATHEHFRAIQKLIR